MVVGYGGAFVGPGAEIISAGVVGGLGNMAFERHGFGRGFMNVAIGSALGGAASSSLNMVPGASWINGFWPSGGSSS